MDFCSVDVFCIPMYAFSPHKAGLKYVVVTAVSRSVIDSIRERGEVKRCSASHIFFVYTSIHTSQKPSPHFRYILQIHKAQLLHAPCHENLNHGVLGRDDWSMDFRNPGIAKIGLPLHSFWESYKFFLEGEEGGLLNPPKILGLGQTQPPFWLHLFHPP